MAHEKAMPITCEKYLEDPPINEYTLSTAKRRCNCYLEDDDIAGLVPVFPGNQTAMVLIFMN